MRPISSSGAEVNPKVAFVEEKTPEEDITRVKESLSALNAINRGLTKIQLQQKRDRHRLDLHSETNKSNYSNVFFGSIFETFVFIAVAIFQVGLFLLIVYVYFSFCFTCLFFVLLFSHAHCTYLLC